MQITVATVAKECLLRGGQTLVQMYTDTALLLNACDVTACSYAARKDNFQLSTTQQIPALMRLPVEIDVVLHRDQLPPTYQGQVLRRIAEDFVVRMVSVIDGAFEDIYESTLPLVFVGIGDDDVSKRVRSAWQVESNGHVKLLKFLEEEAGLVSPPEKTSTVKMVFDRYYELREIRHALVHTGGVLSAKHKRRLRDFSSRLPETLRGGSLANAGFLASGTVVLSVLDMLKLRQWAYSTLFGYLQDAFDRSVTP